MVPHFLSLLGHTHSKWSGFSYFSTMLVHSPQEINHYIKANIRTLYGQVVLCRKVRTNLSNLDQFDEIGKVYQVMEKWVFLKLLFANLTDSSGGKNHSNQFDSFFSFISVISSSLTIRDLVMSKKSTNIAKLIQILLYKNYISKSIYLLSGCVRLA